MLGQGQVDEAVAADHGVEGRGRQAERGDVGVPEGRGRDQATGALDLDLAEVDAGDRAAGAGQLPSYRDAVAAAEVETAAPAGMRVGSAVGQGR